MAQVTTGDILQMTYLELTPHPPNVPELFWYFQLGLRFSCKCLSRASVPASFSRSHLSCNNVTSVYMSMIPIIMTMSRDICGSHSLEGVHRHRILRASSPLGRCTAVTGSNGSIRSLTECIHQLLRPLRYPTFVAASCCSRCGCLFFGVRQSIT